MNQPFQGPHAGIERGVDEDSRQVEGGHFGPALAGGLRLLKRVDDRIERAKRDLMEHRGPIQVDSRSRELDLEVLEDFPLFFPIVEAHGPSFPSVSASS